MDQRFGPRDIIDDADLRALSRRSNRLGLAQLGAHLTIFCGSGIAVWLTHSTVWVAAFLPVHGVILIFLFAPLHESIHRTAFRTRWLNDAVAWLSGLPLLLAPRWFRHFHFAHHRWTQDPARDPELNPPRPASRRAWAWHVSGLPYWMEAIRGLASRASGHVVDPFVSERDQPALVREARYAILVYGALLGSATSVGALPALFWLWLLPAIVGQPVLRLFLLAEHWGCEIGPDMFRNTRSTGTTAAVRFLAWNMPYHAGHHAFPGVPFHALPRLHNRLAPYLSVLAPGYVAVSATIFGQLGRARPQP
jgi:fatty acid desaturase